MDEIEFKFTHVDPNNWDRVFTFVVDVREPKVYKCAFSFYKKKTKVCLNQRKIVTRCEPALPKVEYLLIWLNATRDFYTFLKLMRKGFMELAKSESESASLHKD